MPWRQTEPVAPLGLIPAVLPSGEIDPRHKAEDDIWSGWAKQLPARPAAVFPPRQSVERATRYFFGLTISSEVIVGRWAEQTMLWRPGLSAVNVTLLTWPRFSSNVWP